MSMIKDMKTYLLAKGIDKTIYLGSMPDAPDEAIALYEDEGASEIAYTDLKRMGLTVLLRVASDGLENGYQTMEDIYSVLDEVGNEMLDKGEAVEICNRLYFRILSDASGCALLKDESGRTVLKREYTVVCN